MTTTPAAERPGGSTCWCCGRLIDEARMAHLGAHPEVSVCVRCARLLYRSALLADQHASTSPAARVRRAARAIRRRIVRRGLHQRRGVGPLLRWLGRRLP